MVREYNSKSKELNEIIEKLYVAESENDCRQICDLLRNIYLNEDGSLDENFRHEYAGIYGKIKELSEQQVEGIHPFQISYLLDNINNVYDYAVKNEEPYIKNLFKLKDHIGLEAGRIELVKQLRWEIEHSIDSVKDQIKEIGGMAGTLREQIGQSSKLVSEFQEESAAGREKLEELDDLSHKMKRKIEDIHRDSITILGIFASIVLSFTAEIVFSSSVLENIHKGSPYRIFAVITLLGVIVINLVTILLAYIDKIRKISDNKIEYPSFLIVLDILAAVALIIIFVVWRMLEGN
ncbi:MAG: hypothetical protein NC242_10985 [Roseburia sp.]|nr:hypothetical protein [Roseburia sp.]MCM1430252.1 hypothetical protein [Muribaculaceae bacterium]